jgi:hypothetical protein
MRKVFKYKLKIDEGEQRLNLHGSDVRILSAAMQVDDLCMWIEADTDRSHVNKRFAVFGTGHPIDEEWQWCATVHAPPYVWHVYSK